MPIGTPLDQDSDRSDTFFFPSGAHLTSEGIAFGVAGDDLIYNLYHVDTDYFEFSSQPEPAAGPIGSPSIGPLILTITPLDVPATPAPEIAIWGMMALGFGIEGAAARRRRATHFVMV